MQPTHLVVGHITKPHGTKGEVFVWPLTDNLREVFGDGRTVMLGDEHGALDESAEALTVEATREFKRGLLVKFEQHDDRNAVEEFAQRYLLAPIEQLAPLEENEVYYHQLLGMKVVTREGQDVGRVKEVFETFPAHLLEVRSDSGKVHLIPFADRIVKKVDVDAGQIVIAPTPGLLDI